MAQKKRSAKRADDDWASWSSRAILDYHRQDETRFGRKFLLFACGCARQGWRKLPAVSRRAVELGERIADRHPVSKDEAFRIDDAARSIKGKQINAYSNLAYILTDPEWGAEYTAACAVYEDNIPESILVAIARDVFANPLRPPTIRRSWLTTTVLQIAERIYETHDFSTMPILADALQDAGCDATDILDHCRGTVPHVRGCWVVDLVLGKE